MEYFKVLWKHNHADEPVWLYCEIDDERWETRKVEVFRDGTKGYAAQDVKMGGTGLGLEPTPSLAEIAVDPQFVPSVISKDEFERVWSGRKENVRVDSA